MFFRCFSGKRQMFEKSTFVQKTAEKSFLLFLKMEEKKFIFSTVSKIAEIIFDFVSAVLTCTIVVQIAGA